MAAEPSKEVGMPWKTQDVMDLRMEFVIKALQPGANIRALCREAGISPKTGYKWQERFLAEGKSGLADASRRPHSSPHQVPEAVVCELVRLKQAHRGWGPRKIRELYRRLYGGAPSASSCKRILTKAGLVQTRRPRKVREPGRISRTVVARAPNDVWTVDFKGWWHTGGQRCEPLTVRDDFSRFILGARAMSSTAGALVRTEFERLFEEYGLPRVIRSDNGTPFACGNGLLGLTRLSAWWLVLGIDLDRIRPGHPEENGGHERMHRDIAHEIEGLVSGGLAEQQAALDVWRQSFNEERPHEALKMKTPAQLYRTSSRSYKGTPDEIAYKQGYLIRRVNHRGIIKIHANHLFISESLCGWDLGLNPINVDEMELWFTELLLGKIDLTRGGFLAAVGRQEPTSPPCTRSSQ
jgi:transposase InsO family protein